MYCRYYSDRQIISSLETAFRTFTVRTVEIKDLELVSSLRPVNHFNRKCIRRSLKATGYWKSEPLLVWHLHGQRSPIILGSTRFDVFFNLSHSDQVCYVIYVEGLDRIRPSVDDIWFACQKASMLEPSSFPRSAASKLLEVNGMITRICYENSSDASQISVTALRNSLGQVRYLIDLTLHRHWVCGIGDDMLRVYLQMSRCFRVADMFALVEMIEKHALEPAKQVSQRYSQKLSSLEMRRAGEGKAVLQAFVDKLMLDGTNEIVARLPSGLGLESRERSQPAETVMKRGLTTLVRGLNQYSGQVQHDSLTSSVTEITEIRTKILELRTAIERLP